MSDIIELLEARTKLKHNYPADRDVLKQASDEITRLREENVKIRAAFRVNMLRAFPNMSHEEIDAEIEAAIHENEYWNMESITQNIRENE